MAIPSWKHCSSCKITEVKLTWSSVITRMGDHLNVEVDAVVTNNVKS